MAIRKQFNIHDLYPAGYCFDREAFRADPEHYKFSADDTAYFHAMELEEYEMKTPMTPYEKRALRRWVISGHSVMDTPPSKYGCVYPSEPEPDFLEVYRTDRELDAATKGMSRDQKITYLKEYIGYEDETDEERQAREEKEQLHRNTPQKSQEKIRMLQRKLHYLWMYLIEEGLWEEAEEYIKEHMDEPTPFEDEW